jgi:putative flavoprotein involved in K+ transport
MFDVKRSDVKDPSILETRPPIVSGTGLYGHTVSLQSLAKKGAVLLGTLHHVDGDVAYFKNNVKMHVAAGDQSSKGLKQQIDLFIEEHNLPYPAAEYDEADIPDEEGKCISGITELDFNKENITCVIWATGYGGNFDYLKIPVLDEGGKPIHEDGIAPVRGVYFIGFVWLRTRKSGIIYGIQDDALFIADQVEKKRSAIMQ